MTPTDSGANASMDSLIDSTLDSSAASADTAAVEASPEATADLEASEPAEAQPEAVEAAPVEETAPVAEVPVEEAQPDEFEDDDLSKPDRVSRDGKMHWYKAAKAQKLYQSHQAWRAVQEAVPGASVDTIKEMYEATAGIEAMQADFSAGAVDNFAKFWAGENPQAFTQMMMKAPQYLAQMNPQAAQALEQRVSGALLDRLYKEGQAQNDDGKIAVAQHLEKMLTGKYRDLRNAPKVDPLAEREALLNQREQKIQQQLQQEQSQRRAAWLRDTDSAVESTVSTMIDKALALPELKVFEGRRELTWMKRDLQDAVKEAEKASPTWARQYEAVRKQAEARPSEEARKNLVAMKEQFVRQVIAKNRKAIIETATGKVMSKSAAAHSKMQQSATRTEPANAGSPVQGVAVNPKARDAKTMDALLSAVLG